MSAHAVPVYRERALAVGIDAFAAKPASGSSLRNLVARWADRRPIILTVDGSGGAAPALRECLEQGGEQRLWAVRDIAAAARVLEARPIALIVLDLEAVNMDGYEAIRSLRKRAGPEAPGIIALSDDTSEQHSKRCLAVGCDAHLVKPVATRVLQTVVRRLLERACETPSAGLRIANLGSAPVESLRTGYLQRRIADIKTALVCLSEGRPEQLTHARTLAHNTKGTGGAYGFPWLTERASELEHAIAQGSLEEGRTIAEALLLLLERASAEAERSQPFQNETPVPD